VPSRGVCLRGSAWWVRSWNAWLRGVDGSLAAKVRPASHQRRRCGICGRRSRLYDQGEGRRRPGTCSSWRRVPGTGRSDRPARWSSWAAACWPPTARPRRAWSASTGPARPSVPGPLPSVAVPAVDPEGGQPVGPGRSGLLQVRCPGRPPGHCGQPGLHARPLPRRLVRHRRHRPGGRSRSRRGRIKMGQDHQRRREQGRHARGRARAAGPSRRQGGGSGRQRDTGTEEVWAFLVASMAPGRTRLAVPSRPACPAPSRPRISSWSNGCPGPRRGRCALASCSLPRGAWMMRSAWMIGRRKGCE
jgi:hypothetical protein